MDPQSLPETKSLKWSLGGVVAVYISFGIVGIVFLKLGGKSWNGDTNTLTTVLAVFGALFTVVSRFLLSQCQTAGLQRLASQAIKSSVLIESLNRMDIALHGSMIIAVKSGWGWLYRVLLPVGGILMSAAFKKALDTGLESIVTTIQGTDASFVDPTNVGSRLRGTLFAGAIIYNITTSIGSGLNPAQSSWTYMSADMIELSGLNSVQYFMPDLPRLIAAGSSGYTSYAATSVPALVSQVQCSATKYAISNPHGSIDNGNNVILLDYVGKIPVIQVQTATKTTWSCLANLGTANGTVKYVSDGSGNWNISSVSMSNTDSLDFVTTPARWDMMADIISDALGTTAGYSGWNWDSSTAQSVGYSTMLVSTRLSFAAATLAFSEARSEISSVAVTGMANQPVQKIVLLANWALIMTTVLLLLQGLVAAAHIFPLGKWKLEFGILQIMEMRTAEAGNIDLQGHCSKIRDGTSDGMRLAVRSNGEPEGQRHLGFVRMEADGKTTPPWVHPVGDQQKFK